MVGKYYKKTKKSFEKEHAKGTKIFRRKTKKKSVSIIVIKI